METISTQATAPNNSTVNSGMFLQTRIEYSGTHSWTKDVLDLSRQMDQPKQTSKLAVRKLNPAAISPTEMKTNFKPAEQNSSERLGLQSTL